MAVRLAELVEQAAFELVGLHPDDQGAALAAACEALAETLHEHRPWLSDAEVRKACAGLAKAVKARLREINCQAASPTIH